MEIQDYQKKASRTNADCGGLLMDNIHMVLGMQTESAELADVLKKNIAYGKEIDWVNIKEEIGDLMWYVANMCNINGWDLRDILDTNIKKLEARYPEKFTKENATNRDLVKEREILEDKKLTQESKSYIVRVIADKLVIGPNTKITEDSNIKLDFGADSIDKIEIAVELEKHFNITIPDSLIENAVYVKDFFSAIESLKN